MERVWLRFVIFTTLIIALLSAPGYSSRVTNTLSEDEKFEAFWPAFKFFDTDKDARISANEISEAIKNAGDDFFDDEITSMIRALGGADNDGDSKINFSEFADMMIAAGTENEL